jgi:uncharacterized protein (TIGR03382 family)
MNKHTRGKQMLKWLFCCVSAVVASTNSAQAAIIDDFSSGTFSESGGAFSNSIAGTMIGGFRDVAYIETAVGVLDITFPFDGGDGVSVHTLVDVDTSIAGNLVYREFFAAGIPPFGISDSNGRMTITYDATGAGLGSANIGNIATDFLTLKLSTLTASMTGTITFTDGGSSDSVDIGVSTLFPFATTMNIPLSAFTGIDFTDIESIALDFDSITDGVGGSGGLVVIESLAITSTIPEPSAFALAALGLLSLGMIGRRRRRR